jgi:hypothetical protein
MSPAESGKFSAPVRNEYPLANYIHTQERFKVRVWVHDFDYADVMEAPFKRGTTNHRPQNQVAVLDICCDYAAWRLSRTCADDRKSAALSDCRVK